MIKVNFENYGTENALADVEVGGQLEIIADQIALIIREAARGKAGWRRITKLMMNRIYFQLKTLEDIGYSNTLEEDFGLLNAAWALDIEKEVSDPEPESEMTVKSESGSKMTVTQTGKGIEIKMTTKED